MVQPIVVVDLSEDVVIVGEENDFTAGSWVLGVSRSSRNFAFEDGFAIELAGQKSGSPERMNPGFVVVPYPDHGDLLPLR